MYRAQIAFPSPNVDIATLAKGVRLRALNMNPEAAWIDYGSCLDIADSKVDIGIKRGVDSELTSAHETKKPETAGSPKHCMVVVREVQGLEDNVHQLNCDGLALTPI